MKRRPLPATVPHLWLAAYITRKAGETGRLRSVDHYRRATHLTREPPEALETIVDPQPSAEAALIVGETHALIHSSLNSIEPRAQRLIRAAFFDGATYAELAKREGVPLPTMKSTIRRALARVRDGVSQP